ncbi:MAG TPA: hypothetical protein VJS13_04680 [Pyrinomonadaceae bacterium]|nr:hypothetical protein [Pyrinomonadaceae bacterium]
MDRVTAILKFQWRAYWRRFRGSASLRADNVGILMLFGGLASLRFLQQIPIVVTQLAGGQTARYEMLLTVVFFAWMVPVMGESRRSIASRSLLHFPLTSSELFLVRIGSVFCSPLSWIVIALSLTLSLPVAVSEHPLAGMIGLLALLLLGLFVSLTIMHLLQGAFARRLSFVVLTAVSIMGGLLWLQKQTQFAITLRSLMPHRFAVDAATSSTPFRSVIALVVLTAIFAVLALWTFTFTLHSQQTRRAQRLFSLNQLPGKFGGLLRKDLRYSNRLLDVYLVVPIIILFNLYVPSDPIAFAIVIAVMFLPCMSIVFNCFGLDSALALDRYTLFPLSGKEKLFSKNLAFGVMMFALLITILPVAFWTQGLRVALIGLIEFCAVILAYMFCGNWFSVKQPFRMQFYRFASGGSFVDAVIGIMIASAPAAFTVYLLAIEDGRIGWKLAGVTLLSLALYLLSLSRSARVLEREHEQIRRVLS